MEKRNPIVAAICGLVLGPIGYLYIGATYAVFAFAMVVLLVVVLSVLSLPIPSITAYLVAAIFAWKAWVICTVRNELIDANDPSAEDFNRVAVVGMAMTDLFVGLSMAYGASLGLTAAASLFSDGRWFLAILALTLLTPLLTSAASFAAGLLAMALDGALFLSAESRNMFRNRGA